MKRDNNIQEELIEISSFIANVPFVNVYTCSSDYFDHLSKEVLLIINCYNDEKLEFKNLKETNTYQTPPGYFDNFSNNVIQAIHNDAKVNKSNIYNLNLVKFAFAACFISLLGFFIYKFPSLKQNDKLDPKTASLIKEADLIIRKGSFENEMDKIDEMDLVKYLQDGGQDVDAALVASLDDETQLNDKEIYLYDGETLTKYMNELNIQHSNYTNN
jgi:hypothetical protein